MTPYYYGIFLLTAFASLGLPGLAGFWAEFFVFRGAFQIMPWFAAIGIIGIVVTAAYILWKIVQYVFLGDFSWDRWKAGDPWRQADRHGVLRKGDHVAAGPVHDRLWRLSHAAGGLLQHLCPVALWWIDCTTCRIGCQRIRHSAGCEPTVHAVEGAWEVLQDTGGEF